MCLRTGMTTYLPLMTLVLGFALNEFSRRWSDRRARSDRRQDQRDTFQAKALAEALPALDDAYEAASAIALNSGSLGRGSRPETEEEWAHRGPYVQTCGRASIAVRRVAVLFPPNESPRQELEWAAQATADMTGEGTTEELLGRWQHVEPTVIAAREAVGVALRALYRPPALQR